MASASLSSAAPVQEPDLTREQWWALFDELRLSQQADYAEYGGPVAFIRRERDDDTDPA